MADPTTFLGAYGTGLLPGCHCFQQRDDERDIPESGQMMLTAAVQLSSVVTTNLIMLGVCPGAFPHMLAVLTSSSLLEMCDQRRTNEHDALAVSDDFTARIDELIRLLGDHRDRVVLRLRDMALQEGVAGTC